MSRLLVAQRALTVPGWAKDALWRNARAVPSLDLRFADNKSLVDAVTGASLITFTRASSGTFVGSDGVLRTAANDVARFDHNPTTGESLGLLVEEQRTNSIANNTGVGAVAGAPGTLPTNWTWNTAGGASTEVVGTGTENGIAYVDVRLFGTLSNFPSIQFVANTAIAATTGQAWTETIYCKIISLVSGTSDPRLRITERTAAGAYLTEGHQPFTPGISSVSLIASRFTFTRTLTNALTGSVVPAILFNQASGAIDITLRIGLPQLEQGAFATSPIMTSTAAATRSASLADLINSAIANNIRSFYVEFSSPAVGTRGAVSLNDNTANERADLLTSGTDPRLVVHDGGAGQANIDGGTVTAGVRTRIAVRINTNDFAISINGGAVATDTSGTLPTVDRLMFGRTQAGEYLNGRIARFTGWTGLLPDSTLQALTQ